MQALLDKGLAALEISASAEQRAQWLAYVQLLAKWNQAYNLTAVREPREMVSRHLLDSLAVAKHMHSTRLLDVGAGAGIPSIPLAILWPERQLTALDSNGKKTRFMDQARIELGLQNFSVVQSRVEEYQSELPFDGILSRAYASLADFVQSSQHLLAAGGCFWAMKAQLDSAELSALPKPFKVSACLRLQVPNCNAERHLIRCELSDGIATT
ncbi:MAG: 16S rRNA (guanine(527)-N(7))-methyltransferase RsmG [Pseudomonadales bacterium]